MKNINETMKELAEMTAMLEETKAIIDSLQEEVKAYMTAEGIDEILSETGEKATWREVISSRFDSTAFKKDFSDIYKEYTKKRRTNVLHLQPEREKARGRKNPLAN